MAVPLATAFPSATEGRLTCIYHGLDAPDDDCFLCEQAAISNHKWFGDPLNKQRTEVCKMTRQEHLDWCKKRAMEYVNAGDLLNGVTSMMSDLTKHPDTEGSGKALAMLGILALKQAQDGDRQGVVRYITGFN